MMYLHIKAPFAAFRTFTAGSFRPSAPFITPSAAYGLLMNIAGIETRHDDGISPMTLSSDDTPELNIAIGAVSFPERQSMFQQLHNYPVGSSNKQRADSCRGSKYNIQPVRREFLSGIDACIAIDGNDETEQMIRQGLRGERNGDRYGMLFLGDNTFMPDLLKETDAPLEAHWYVRLPKGTIGPKDRLCRLTINIDRSDMSKTTAPLFYPTDEKTGQIPKEAWSKVGPAR